MTANGVTLNYVEIVTCVHGVTTPFARVTMYTKHDLGVGILFATISGVTAGLSYVDRAEQWLRIMATVIALISGIIALYHQLRKHHRRKKLHGDE